MAPSNRLEGIHTMDHDPRTDIINRQYEKYPYPEPIADLDEWSKHSWEWFDPSKGAHRMLWPDKEYRPDLDILIAGCGTNQAACFAYGNPQAKVVAVDISEASLDHQRCLKAKHNLTNLELHRLPIEELPTLGRDFDLVVSTGVLMIMADPVAGLKAIGECMRRDGAIGLMLYAHHGRFGVYLLQSVFRTLGLGQDERSLQMVRETLRLLHPDHPLHSYLKYAPDLDSDAGMVDTFLIGRDVGYTVEDCLDLVESAGLAFQGWFVNSPYHPHTIDGGGTALYTALNALPPRQMWSAMECLWTSNGCHFFMACRRDRPPASYQIDLASPKALDYVPEWRYRCGLSDNEIFRPRWRFPLNPESLSYARLVDGTRSIREIAALVGDGPASAATARRIFEDLRRLDVVAMALPPPLNPLFRNG